MLTAQDQDHLNLLGIFYYVWAGLSAFGGVASLFVFVLMIGGMSAAMANSGQGGGLPAEIMVIMVIIVVFSVVLSLGSAVLYYYCGRFLRERRKRTFCFVIAVITCMSVPLGTILGIFTIVVLNRPSVQDAFAALD